jgi:hypothetical protein
MSQTDKVKYPRVLVDTVDPHENPAKVNVRVPVRLLRAADRVIPPAREEVNAALRKEAIAFDINNVTPQNLQALIEQFRSERGRGQRTHQSARFP